MTSPASGSGTKSHPLSLPSLILLPPPPRPATRSTLNAAFRPPLEAAISRLKDDGDDGAKLLIVALAAPFLTAGQSSPRHKTLSWPEAQTLLAGLYSIISTLCAKLSLPAEVHAGPGSVDARVVLVDYHPSLRQPQPQPQPQQYSDFRPAIETNSTTIVDLATFASAYHPWKYIFHVNNEAGYSLLTTYLKMFEGVQPVKQAQVILVEGGLVMNVKPSDPPHFAPQTTNPHSIVCLGGTFDHLHPGHKLLLHAAVLLLNVPEKGAKKPCRFIIGVTGDELLKRKKYAEFVQPWDLRVNNVIEFLSTVLHLSKSGWKREQDVQITRKGDEVIAYFREGAIEVQCVVLQDTFGPTTATEDMDALVVSGETRSGGQAVNAKRQELGWHPLEVFEVDVLDAEEIDDEHDEQPTKTQDFATKISSTAIRKQKAEATATAART